MSEDAAPTPAEALKARLRADLRIAMRARAINLVSVLRVCLAAIDNAEAPPAGEARQPYEARPFGDGSADVPRLELDEEALKQILRTEIAAREEDAAEFARTGGLVRAKTLKDEAMIIARYLRAPA